MQTNVMHNETNLAGVVMKFSSTSVVSRLERPSGVPTDENRGCLISRKAQLMS
jgi:hypothetical protein